MYLHGVTALGLARAGVCQGVFGCYLGGGEGGGEDEEGEEGEEGGEEVHCCGGARCLQLRGFWRWMAEV